MPPWLRPLALAGWLLGAHTLAQDLSASRLGVIFNIDDEASRRVAGYYAAQRVVPATNVVGVRLPMTDVLSPEEFRLIRQRLLDELPSRVQSLVLVWSRPFAVGCMSVTSAFAAGYRDEFCKPGCGATAPNPLFDSTGWLPADTVGWWPAMLLPSDDWDLAEALVRRGIAADHTAPAGTFFLVRTADRARNVRAATYDNVELVAVSRARVMELTTPGPHEAITPDAIGYFTGSANVAELPMIHFRPGALADHLTSTGGVLAGGNQMSSLEWLRHGATASYGSVSEPCNHLEKFPNLSVLLAHYLHGETALEAYWKSVAMPGQGIFIGEPLSRPYARN